jgi:hypothetical protein
MTYNKKENQELSKFKHNIVLWMQFWRENAIYGIMSREIYKMAGRNRNTTLSQDKDFRMYMQWQERLKSVQFSQYWGTSTNFKSHALIEHFTMYHYTNPLGSKIDEILGSFSQATYTPKLISDETIQIPEFASMLQKKLEKFFNQEENIIHLVHVIDSVLSSGYGVLKINYKNDKIGNLNNYEIFLEPVNYPEMAFFSPFSKSPTKNETFTMNPNAYCGLIHKVSREEIKERYKKELKGNEPQSISIEEKQSPFLYYLMQDSRDLVFIAEYFDYTKEGKVRRTLMSNDCILEQSVFEWSCLPLIYVDGASAYSSDIQKTASIFEYALAEQKELSWIASRIHELIPYTKTNTFAFTNNYTLDEKFMNDVKDISNSNYLVLAQTTAGTSQQLPPELLSVVDLPPGLLEAKQRQIQYLDQMMKGHYDEHHSNFAESGEALKLKEASKNNLFSRQFGNIKLALKKFCEFYKQMFYPIYIHNTSDVTQPLLDAFQGSYDSYLLATKNISFDLLIDTNLSLSQEANRTAIVEGMQYIQEPHLREIFIREYVKNMKIPDPDGLLRKIDEAIENNRQLQMEEAKKPDELVLLQRDELESREKIAKEKIEADLIKNHEKNLTQLTISGKKLYDAMENRSLKEWEILQMQNQKTNNNQGNE